MPRVLTWRLPAPGLAAVAGITLGVPEMWQVSLPGTPHLVAPVDEHLAVVPVGLDLHGIDPATGATLWVEEHDNPGRGGSYNQPGTFWFVAGSDDVSADVAVGVVRAEQEYRD